MRATNIRKGNVLKVNAGLYRVMAMDHITPGKGNAIVQTKLRNLLDGTQTELRFRSADDVERVSLEVRMMQYLYSDASGYHFMDTDTYDQAALNEDILGDAMQYIVPESIVKMEWYEGKPVGLELPASVDLTITETMPGIKDSTASAQKKPATLETGLTVQVPSFIEPGEKIRVSTLDGSYLERAK